MSQSQASWLRAYLPPACLGAQGLMLLVFLERWVKEPFTPFLALSLGCLIFSSYLFEGMGFFSPEDRINQPQRFFYFQQHWRTGLALVVLSASAGMGLAGTKLFSLRLLSSLVATTTLFTLYALLRWKKFGLLKPLMVSLAWMSALLGFSRLSLSHEIFLIGILLGLLFLDSLWLDLRDKKGDQEYGFKVGHLSRSPFLTLWIGHLVLGFVIFFFSKNSLFLNGANLILALSGTFGFQSLPRWVYGMVIPLWSFYLGLFF